MFAYILKRLLLMLPTLLGVLLLTFAVIQFVPGGPVEQYLAEARAGAGGGSAEGGGMAHGGIQLPGQAHVDAEAGTPVALVHRIQPWRRRADEAPGTAVLGGASGRRRAGDV